MSIALDYLSPLPPVRSGIADYSIDLLPELDQRTDLRVLRVPGQPVADEVETRWQPVAAEAALAQAAPAEEAASGRLPVYHLGNNPYHDDIERLARRYPGVVTLHDLVLHHLLCEQTLRGGDYRPYQQRLLQDHGWVGGPIARARRWGEPSEAALFSLPAHRSLLRAQRGVLVHNRWAAAQILEFHPDVRVRVVPMGIPLPPAADAHEGRELRRRFGIPDHTAVLGSFGFQTPIKRTERVVEALAQPGLEDAHLLIVGQVSAACQLQEAAAAAGVAERVHITGFVNFDDFEAAIAATDLALNLRYPTAGETSASLLRVLAVGRPAVVSDYGQFHELPDACVIKVPLGDGEVEALAEQLRQLLAAPEELLRMGAAARAHVEQHHHPAAAAEAVIEACREWKDLEPPAASSPDAEPWENTVTVTTRTASELPGTLDVTWQTPWPAGNRRTLQFHLANTGTTRWLAGLDGPGGVALQVQLLRPCEDAPRAEGTIDLLAGQPWIPLPRPLDAGETCELSVEIRRPPGVCTLRVEPHVLGSASFSRLGGPVLEATLEM